MNSTGIQSSNEFLQLEIYGNGRHPTPYLLNVCLPLNGGHRIEKFKMSEDINILVLLCCTHICKLHVETGWKGTLLRLHKAV